MKLRLMVKEDLDFCVELFNIAGWGNTENDALRMLHFSPTGCFIASLGNNDVGLVSSINYNNQGWIGNLIVRPEYRGKGIGTELMKRAIKNLETQGIKSIRLDAVPLAIKLYERLGFKPEFYSLRFIGVGKMYHDNKSLIMEKKDLKSITKFDKIYFGSSRKKILHKLFEEFHELCFTLTENDQPIGYIMGKKGEEINRIGPWICYPRRSDIAEILLKRLMSKLNGKKLWIGVPEMNSTSISILIRNGFQQQISSLRMCRGKCNALGNIFGRFSIGAPDKG